MQTGLRSLIRVRFMICDGKTFHRANIDDARGIIVHIAGHASFIGGGTQQRKALLRKREDAVQIQSQQLRPRRLQIVIYGVSPGCAGIVDQDVQATFLRKKARSQASPLRSASTFLQG